MIFASVVGALIILAILSWKDLNTRTRQRRGEGLQAEGRQPEFGTDLQDELPQPPPHLSPEQITRARRLYVIAFWGGIGGNLLLWVAGLLSPALIGVLTAATALLLLLFLYASFRILQVMGHDPLTCAMLCILPLLPIFALIQYFSIGHRCNTLFGSLRTRQG